MHLRSNADKNLKRYVTPQTLNDEVETVASFTTGTPPKCQETSDIDSHSFSETNQSFFLKFCTVQNSASLSPTLSVQILGYE